MWLDLPLLQYLLAIINNNIMKGSLVTILVLLLSLYHVDAFLPRAHPRADRAATSCTLQQAIKSTDLGAQPLTHAEIIWKLRPPPGTSAYRKLLLRLGANVIRLESAIRGVDPPFVLCPKGGQAVLEAYYQGMMCTKSV